MGGERGPQESQPARMASAARDMEAQVDPQATYVMAAELAVQNIDSCEVASLTIGRKRRWVETRGATHDSALAADRLQHELGEGPCVDSIWEELAVYSPSLAHDQRWPAWGPRVVEETGLQSALAFRLFSHSQTVGSLNMFSSARDAFDDEDRADGLALAAHIGIAVVASQNAAELDSALSSRTVIGQATGILMERYGVTADVAFSILARTSSTEQVKLRDIAEEVAGTGRLRGTERSTPAGP